MKFLYTVFLISILINISFGNDGFIQITPYGSGSNIIESSTECSTTTPYGQGYYLPTGTEIQVEDECFQFDLINSTTHLRVSYLGKNCTLEHPIITIYPIGECIDFKLSHSPESYQSIITANSESIPTNAIYYEYYYFSNYCSGPKYKVFYTNGYSNQFSKYQCVNGKPQVFECTGSGSCAQIDTKGCQIKGELFPYDIKC